MRQGWCEAAAGLALALVATLAVAAPVAATMKYGGIEISGNVESQNLVRHAQADELNFIQNRNTFRLRVDWDWLENGKLLQRYDLPLLERSKFYLLYRGVYDGFYDLAPTELQHGQTRFDDQLGGRITDLSRHQRGDVKFENELREIYIDSKFKDYPISLRIGRQQVVWGESDQFRVMDIWNPLDVTWHFQQESWDNLRIPLWLAKGLWDLGDVWNFSNVFAEVVYNPFDFQPGIKAAFLPRPWALPFADPLRAGQVSRTSNLFLSSMALSPVFDLQGTNYRHGDFERNPQDASEVGARFHFTTPFGLELTPAYLYGRGRGIGAAAPFGVKIERLEVDTVRDSSTIGRYQIDESRPVGADALTQRCSALTADDNAVCALPVHVRAKVVHPYVHIFGLTGNYFEEKSEVAMRFEMAYALGEPYQSTEEDRLPPQFFAGQQVGTGPFGLVKRDVWAGMIGFDRPTWIHWLNPAATWFITGQFFWSHIPGHNVDKLVGTVGAGDDPYYGPVGRWLSGPYEGQTERQQNGDFKGNGDQVRRWEHLITIAGTTFYRGGTVVPLVASAWDPVNSNLEVLWKLDYFLTSDFILSLQQRYFMGYGSDLPSNDPWYAGGRFSRRDETGAKLTYQF